MNSLNVLEKMASLWFELLLLGVPVKFIPSSWCLKVDPARCVKEYRKEAADNKIAAANSIRPVPVLSRTMSYLIHEVSQQAHGCVSSTHSCVTSKIVPMETKMRGANKIIWYSFISDRMRAICKVSSCCWTSK